MKKKTVPKSNSTQHRPSSTLNLKIANSKKVLLSLPQILHQSYELHQEWISAHFARSSSVSTALTARPTVLEYWQSHYPTKKIRVDKSYKPILHSAPWENTVKPHRGLSRQFQWTNDCILSHKASTRCFCPHRCGNVLFKNKKIWIHW